MSSSSSTYKQPLNKGKGKLGEEFEVNLNTSKEMALDQGTASENLDKGKGISMVKDPNANQDKPKAIAKEEPDASEDSKYPKIFGVILKPSKGKRKGCYPCSSCDKTFPTPQALGGHQNGHKWERSIKQTIEGINKAISKSSNYNFSSSPTLHISEPLNGSQGVSLNYETRNLQHYHIPTPYAMTRHNGYQGDRLDGRSHHAGTTSFNDGSGTLEIGNNGFQHPLGAGFNASSGTYSSTTNIEHSASQHPELGLLLKRNGEDTDTRQDEA